MSNAVSLVSLPAGDTFDVVAGSVLRFDGDTNAPAALSGTFSSTGDGSVELWGSWETVAATEFGFAPGVLSMSLDQNVGQGLVVSNPLTNSGDATLSYGRVTGGTVTNTGTWTFAGSTTTTLGGSFVNDNTVTQVGGLPLTLNGAVTTAITNNGLWDIASNAGVSWSGTGTDPSFTNSSSGTLRKSAGTSQSSFASAVDFSSVGVVESQANTLSILDADGIPQLVAGVLTDGVWRALNGATLEVGSFAASIVEIGSGATVELSGPGATFVQLADLATNSGSLSIVDEATFITTADLASTGQLTLGSKADLNVTGDFTATTANTLHIQIGGVSSSTEFGQVYVTGTANLAGTLDIDLVGGFTPVPADSYDIVFYANNLGTFTTLNLTPFFSAQFQADKLRLNEAVNTPPVLDPIDNQSGNELSLITFTATASDADPGDTLTFSLVGSPPAGADIDPASGVFTWTPTEDQGPDTAIVTVRVTDDGTPNLYAEAAVSIDVNEVNVAPEIGAIGPQSTDEQVLLAFTATATDADSPANTLSFSLDNGLAGSVPSGAFIHPSTGAFTWTPTEQQGPDTYTFDVVVSDNGTPVLSDAVTVTVTVNEVNQAPVASAGADQGVTVGDLVVLGGSGSDADLPAQTLTYLWHFTLVPTGSTAALTGDTTTSPSFTPDAAGAYVLELIVNDGLIDSLPDTVTITAVPAE
ncbi:MAG: putative Ig domain-containing protein, partial [Acidimicrobiia bacterium]|nr:putative Ig domain-containing protein [Acidimicrobiia bacterium]